MNDGGQWFRHHRRESDEKLWRIYAAGHRLVRMGLTEVGKMSTIKYILVDQKPVPCEDLHEWAKWMEADNRIIAQTTMGNHWISTVFLGLEHNFGHEGDPIVFETMVFCREHECELDNLMDRYAHYLDALEGHMKMLERVWRERS